MSVIDVFTAVTIGVAFGGVGRAVTRNGRPGTGTLMALGSAAAAATAAVVVRRDLSRTR
jgi:hypothetical protein